jgi:hypothetical protein
MYNSLPCDYSKTVGLEILMRRNSIKPQTYFATDAVRLTYWSQDLQARETRVAA